MRLTPEREKEIRDFVEIQFTWGKEIFAEIDALRKKNDHTRSFLIEILQFMHSKLPCEDTEEECVQGFLDQMNEEFKNSTNPQTEN